MPEPNDDTQKNEGEEDIEKKGGEEENEEEEVLDDKDYAPEIRKTIGEYVAERRAKRAEKKLQEKENDGELDEDDEELEKISKKEEQPDIVSLVQKELQKAIKPITEFARSQATDAEISAYLSANPQFKKYEKLARKDALAYPNVPIEKIFHSFDNSGKLSQKATEEAKEKAKANKIGGTQKRQGATPIHPNLITKEQMDDVRLRARMGEKVNPLEL